MPRIFGRSINVTADDTIVGVDDDLVPFPASPGEFTILSTSADDGASGSGCREVTCEALIEDAGGDWRILRETIPTDGLTACVAFVAEGVGVMRVRTMVSTGVGNIEAPAPAGDITASIGGAVCHRMKAGDGRSTMVVYSTGSTQPESVGFLRAKIVKSGGGAATSAEAQLWIRRRGSGWVKVGNALLTDKDASEASQLVIEPPEFIGFNADVKFDLPSLGGEQVDAQGSIVIAAG